MWKTKRDGKKKKKITPQQQQQQHLAETQQPHNIPRVKHGGGGTAFPYPRPRGPVSD